MDWREARATASIAVVTAITSIALLVSGRLPDAAMGGGFIPLRVDPDFASVHQFAMPIWVTPLSATLIHGGAMHLVLNLFILGYCGWFAERAVGARGVFVLYFVGAYAAAIGHWALGPNSAAPMIGASGAISAIVAAYALLFGQRRAKAIGPLSGEAVHILWLAAAWIGIQALIGLAGGGGFGSIAIGAHIGGFLAGLALARPLLLWRYRGA